MATGDETLNLPALAQKVADPTSTHDVVPETTTAAESVASTTTDTSGVWSSLTSSSFLPSSGLASENMPQCFSQIKTLTNYSHEGIVFYDDSNGFGLEIPEGAIPQEQTITIDIGVALHGPFEVPDGLKRVSPVFWVCAQESEFSHFLKPIIITLPHCLNMKSSERINSLGLTFLKGDHEMDTSQQVYQFQQVDRSQMGFEAGDTKGTLKTTRFCSLCIAAKDTPELTKDLMFCLYAVIPPAVPPLKSEYCYFIICYQLETCIETVENQITKMGLELENPPNVVEFSFKQFEKDPALRIVTHDLTCSEWEIGVQGKTKICPKDVDFITTKTTKNVLQLKERKGMYPPRFRVFISCTTTARLTKAKIEFEGATGGLVYNFPLIPQQISASSS